MRRITEKKEDLWHKIYMRGLYVDSFFLLLVSLPSQLSAKTIFPCIAWWNLACHFNTRNFRKCPKASAKFLTLSVKPMHWLFNKITSNGSKNSSRLLSLHLTIVSWGTALCDCNNLLLFCSHHEWGTHVIFAILEITQQEVCLRTWFWGLTVWDSVLVKLVSKCTPWLYIFNVAVLNWLHTTTY